MRSTLLLFFAVCSCGGTVELPDPDVDDDTDVAPPAYDYALDRVLEVEITLDEAEWAELRTQDRSLLDVITGEDCLEQPFESPYTWFSATVEVDGVLMDNVAVRKKGFIGSVTPDRPSLKLKFDKWEDGQLWEGLERLTLNNGRQDPSRIKQCLGYSMYADAGLAASRCSFAHVVVNGEDLGVYSNVEPVKRAMLERHFDSGDGNLYEGTLSDFRDGWLGTFDDKTEVSDGSDLRAVADALTVPDDQLEQALDEVIDVDQFLQHWAMEVAIGHWDGHAGNRNNYYVYADPSDGRFRFIPWGIDGILRGDQPFGEGQPVSVVGRAMLPYRAIRNPGLQARYIDTMSSTLDRVWDEEVLQARIDDMQDLTEPLSWPYRDDVAYDLSFFEMRQFVDERAGAIDAELRDGLDRLPAGIDPNTPCLVERGEIQIAFDTVWNSNQWAAPWDAGTGSLSITFDGNDWGIEFLGAVVGEGDQGPILMISGRLPDRTGVLVWGRAKHGGVFAAPGSYAADWSDMETYLLVAQGGGHRNYQIVAYTGGSLDLEQTSTTPGERVAGSMDLVIWGAQP